MKNKKTGRKILPSSGRSVLDGMGIADFTGSRMILCANTRLYLENHRAIAEYSPCKIAVRTQRHLVLIEGEELCVQSFTNETMTITGKIGQISFQATEGKNE